jgi:hypothetical protein
MEAIGNDARFLRVKEVVQVTHIVLVIEEGYPDGGETLRENELIIASNRRPIPVPYSEEP